MQTLKNQWLFKNSVKNETLFVKRQNATEYCVSTIEHENDGASRGTASMIIYGPYQTSYGVMFRVMQVGGSGGRSPPGKQGGFGGAAGPPNGGPSQKRGGGSVSPKRGGPH